MKEGWHSRLIRAIELDGRSLREISLEAGLGPNYIQQMVKYDKEPGTAKFVRILEVLGSAASLYVTLGIENSDEMVLALAAASSLRQPQRDALTHFLESLAAEEPANTQGLSPDSPPKASSSDRKDAKKR